jgi:chemotaxis family two-component system response regulator Rcp1
MIEDNPADIRLLRQALDQQELAYELCVLTDGESALRYLAEHCQAGAHPCLIVLDLHLPRYDGAEVLRAIRSTPTLTRVDVAVLTTVASPSEEAAVLALGVSLYARKPSDWDDFIALGAQLLGLCYGDKAKVATAPPS